MKEITEDFNKDKKELSFFCHKCFIKVKSNEYNIIVKERYKDEQGEITIVDYIEKCPRCGGDIFAD